MIYLSVYLLTRDVTLQMLQVSVERLSGVWFEAFSLDTVGKFAMTVSSENGTISLVVEVKQLTNVQKQVQQKTATNCYLIYILI